MNTPSKDGVIKAEDFTNFSKNLLMDNDGSDNISYLNRYLNEMTGIYWVWKNYERFGDPDVIGVSHYRRYFIFDESLPLPEKTWLPHSSCFIFDNLIAAEPYINTKNVEDFFKAGYDCITTRQYDARLLTGGQSIRSCEERFYEIAPFPPNLYKKMEELIISNHPDFMYEVQSLRLKPSHYTFNMFLMRKELFFDYCKFVFPILLELQKSCGQSNSPKVNRAPGFLAEFLTSIFISHAVRIKGVRLKELNTCFIYNTEILQAKQTKVSLPKLYLDTLACLFSLGKIVKREKIEDEKKLFFTRANIHNKKNVRISYGIFQKIAKSFEKISNLFKVIPTDPFIPEDVKKN